MKALLRRYQMLSADIITLHGTTIDRKGVEVKCNGQTILLPLKEFELLSQLASYPGRTFSREELIELVWGMDFEGDERTVDVHVKGSEIVSPNERMIFKLQQCADSVISWS